MQMEHSKHKHALVCREESDIDGTVYTLENLVGSKVDIGSYELRSTPLVIIVR